MDEENKEMISGRFRFGERFVNRGNLGLRRLRRVVQRRDDENAQKHLEMIDLALADAEITIAFAMEVDEMSSPADQLWLSGDNEDGPILRFIRYVIDNPDKLLYLLENLLKLFAVL